MFAQTLVSTVLALGLTVGAAHATDHATDHAMDDQSLLQKGLSAYQNKQYAEARDAFQSLLAQGAVQPTVLHNLALAEFQLDQKPMALALWRKALSIQPSFRPAREGRAYLESKMQMHPFETDSLNLWVHRNLESLSFFDLLWLNALVILLAGWQWIEYFGRRGQAFAEGSSLPTFPTMAALLSAVFIGLVTLAALKGKDSFSDRATITAAKVSARSLPADGGVGLFDLSGGNEVLIRRQQDGWSQVQNSDGSTGWVKDSDLYVTSVR
jgi:tetratricopeptide (TPR) repeat protein